MVSSLVLLLVHEIEKFEVYKMKVVFNETDHGLNLSSAALQHLRDVGVSENDVEYLHRHESELVNMIELLGEKASASGSRLRIAELNGASYIITKNMHREFAVLPEEYNFKYNN